MQRQPASDLYNLNECSQMHATHLRPDIERIVDFVPYIHTYIHVGQLFMDYYGDQQFHLLIFFLLC